MLVSELRPYLNAHWPHIKEKLLNGSYQPSAVREVNIPKPGGKGMRKLGILTVVERLIQQTMHQVLNPIFDPFFSDHSYGFRPGRSAHHAVLHAQNYVIGGRRCCRTSCSTIWTRNWKGAVTHFANTLMIATFMCNRGELTNGCWRQWKRSWTRARKLMKLGLGKDRAWWSATNERGPWWNSGAAHMNQALPGKFFDNLGLINLQNELRRLQCVT